MRVCTHNLDTINNISMLYDVRKSLLLQLEGWERGDEREGVDGRGEEREGEEGVTDSQC